MTDRFVVMTIVVFIGLVALTGLVGTVYLIVHGVDDSALIVTVSSPAATAIGILGTLLANTHSSPPLPPVAPSDVSRSDTDI